MMARCDVVAFIDALPWPEATKPSHVFAYADKPIPGWFVILHEPVSRGWHDRARIHAHTPEGALRMALEQWLQAKNITNLSVFYDALRRLQN